MIKKTILLHIGNDGLSYKEVTGKNIIYRLLKRKKLNMELKKIEELNMDLKNKKIFIVLEEEELYIKNMIMPKLRKEKLYEVIKAELEYNFKNIDNVMFTYQITRSNSLSNEIIVFCLKWNQSALIDKLIKRGSNLKGIYPIQFCVFENYKKLIKDKSYIFSFIYKKALYFLAVIDNKITANSIVKQFEEENFIDELKKFQAKCSELEISGEFLGTYLLNFLNKSLVDNTKRLYKCHDLGEIHNDELEYL